MNSIHIAIRLPGFYAGIEKQMMPEADGSPVVITQGKDHRSLVLSVCHIAKNQGIKPGMRIGDIQSDKVIVIESQPEKYISEIRRMENIILEEIPYVQYLRSGVFMAVWEGKGRFLQEPLERLIKSIKETNYLFSIGIAEEAGLAELAAMQAGEYEIKRIERQDTTSFLSKAPIGHLYDIPREKVLLLKEMGINTCTELARLPDHALVTLFGPEGKKLKTLLLTGKRPNTRLEWRKVLRITENNAKEEELRDKVYGLICSNEINHDLYDYIKTTFYITIVYTDNRRSSGSFRVEQNIHHEGKISELLWFNVKKIWKRRIQLSEIRLRVVPGNLYTGQMDFFGVEKVSDKNRDLMVSIQKLRQKWGSLSVRFANNPIVQRESA